MASYVPKPHVVRNQKHDFLNIRLKEVAMKMQKCDNSNCVHIVDTLAIPKNKCMYCLTNVKSHNIDELIPITKNGNMSNLNRVPACGRCNSSKGNLTGKHFSAWLHSKPYISKSRAAAIEKYVNQNKKSITLTVIQEKKMIKKKTQLIQLWNDFNNTVAAL